MIATTMARHANSLWNRSDDDVDWSLTRSCDLYSFIIYTVIVGTLVVFGVIGNSFAFFVFWKDNIKTSASFLFQGLSFVDSLLLVTIFSIYTIPSFVTYTSWLQGYQAIFPYVGVCMYPLMRTAQTASIWVTVLIAVNRYIAVCLPYKASRLCTVLKAKKQLGVVLLFAVLYNIPVFTMYCVAYETSDNGTTYTAVARNTKLGSEKLYHIIYDNILYFIFLLALPILILAVLNIRLIKALKAFRRKRMEMLSLRQQQDNSVTFILIIVVIFLIISQGLALVNLGLWNMAPETKICGGVKFYLRHIANMLTTLNSAVNFVIYALLNKRFRHVLTLNVCACGAFPRGTSTGRSSETTVTSRVMASPGKENDNTVEKTRF